MNTKENYVELTVPKGYINDDPNVFISLNGKNYLLPKGKTSLVPPTVKAEYDRAQRAQDALEEKSASLRRKAAKPF